MMPTEHETHSTMQETVWQTFSRFQSKGRLGHALLLPGSPPGELYKVAMRMAASILCRDASIACGCCQSCLLVAKNEHPDCHDLCPEKEGAVIKIEQIRQLQTMIVHTPQLGQQRVILIRPAEKLNEASANALLKILEEPAGNTVFILLAEHISTIPPTILSRCQIWRTQQVDRLQDDYLTQHARYAEGDGRAQVLAAADAIIEQLQTVCESGGGLHSVAQAWSVYPFADLIWGLYLIHAQMIQFLLSGQTQQTSLQRLAKRLGVVCLFAQLDKLNEIIGKLDHTFSRNQLLVLEDFLLNYTACTEGGYHDGR